MKNEDKIIVYFTQVLIIPSAIAKFVISLVKLF